MISLFVFKKKEKVGNYGETKNMVIDLMKERVYEKLMVKFRNRSFKK